VTLCPSKSAKKKAKKKAAAARKANGVENDGAEGLALAGTNCHEAHSPEANGATADSSKLPRKKSKSKGMLCSIAGKYSSRECATRIWASTQLESTYRLWPFEEVFGLTESTKKVQTNPPEVPVAELFPRGIFPEGEWQSYQNE